MPSQSYREGFLKKLEDPDYAALYVETALEETIKDGDINAFLSALHNVLEAVTPQKEPVSELEKSRQKVYRTLIDVEELTIELAISELDAVGIVPEVQQPLAPQLAAT